MIIKIANLRDGVHEYKFDENIENIGLNEPFFGNFIFNVKLVKAHNQIILNGELKLNARFICDRCAAGYDSVIRTVYKMVYLFGRQPQDNGSTDVAYLPADADKIDLTNDFHDYAILAVPMKKLCKEDCRGLCYKCGKDLNEGECGCENEDIDERWKSLLMEKKIIKK